MWVLALSLTAIMVAHKIMLRSEDLFAFLLGVVLLFLNITCALINIERLFM